MDCKPAKKMIMLYPMPCQMPIRINAGIARLGSRSHRSGERPNFSRMLLSLP